MRNRRREKKLWQNERTGTPSLGCVVCAEFRVCGGLVTDAKSFDCMRHCCDGAVDCDKVCPRNPKRFCGSMREIKTFELNTIEPIEGVAHPRLPKIVPMVMHGQSHSVPLALEAAAIPFSKLFDKRDGRLRFNSAAELRSYFKLSEETKIVVSGVSEDPPLEAWWGLGAEKRKSVLGRFSALGIQIFTSPNFSLFSNRPRHDDLHSMKRIAIAWSEMTEIGLPCALHVNGRTPRDFERWIEFVKCHPEIQCLSYEFGTGSGQAGRFEQHADWVMSIAKSVGRELGLIFRGRNELIRPFEKVFKSVTFIDTTSFMKSVKRQRFVPVGNHRFEWRSSPTPLREPIDELLSINVAGYAAWLSDQAASATSK